MDSGLDTIQAASGSPAGETGREMCACLIRPPRRRAPAGPFRRIRRVPAESRRCVDYDINIVARMLVHGVDRLKHRA
jgi:hypothetical protein